MVHPFPWDMLEQPINIWKYIFVDTAHWQFLLACHPKKAHQGSVNILYACLLIEKPYIFIYIYYILVFGRMCWTPVPQ
jgi:hypothetical protein